MRNARENALVKVAFDASVLQPRYRNHGIQVYARNLLCGLSRSAERYGIEIRPLISKKKDESTNGLNDAPGFHLRKTSLQRFDRFWRYGGAAAAAFLDRADIMLNPNGASLPIGALLPTVTTIHDLTPMVMPCFPRRMTFLLKFLLSRSAKSSAAIITVSEHSKRDIVRLCGIPESKIFVMYEGYDRNLFHDGPPDSVALQTLCARLGIHRPYILHHGAIQPRKNLPRLIAAYRKVLARNHQLDFDLVLAGPLAWQFEKTVAAGQNVKGCRGKVVFTGALSDSDLSILLRGSVLEVISSLYEGFCLPMIEAMACGIPTIAAQSSCLPEISGGVLRYFDPYSVEEMATCMEEALLSSDLREELVYGGKERAQRFSWELCAEETLSILAQVARTVRVKSRAAGVAL
ncbi:MAG TPA: glycosyltransferase family 1 protein [Candidatus Angelobacter sp.]|jgi:glycosyltransferase involved in cell wall biosynthesis